ncbi:MAG: AI-2E family transporter [Acidobacteriia bacterium]|nr:AI-2E family transporter [Terriglobia bacterium]
MSRVDIGRSVGRLPQDIAPATVAARVSLRRDVAPALRLLWMAMNGSWRSDHVAVALSWIGPAVLTVLVCLIIEPFWKPLGWAAVIAIIFHPVHARFERRWGASRAAALSTVAVTVIVIVPLLLVMTAFVREALDAAGAVQQGFASGRFTAVERAWKAIADRVPGNQRADAAALASDAAKRAAMFLAEQSGAALRNTASFVIDLVLALFATFFLLRDSHAIMRVIRRLLPVDPVMREHLIARTREMVSISVAASGLIAGLQGLLGGLIFAAVGIAAPVFWGVVIGFICLLPLGAWLIWGPAAILLALSGSIGRALIVAGLGVGIVSAVDNVLRPMLVSERTSMNGLLVFISLLGGVAVFGALGLVLGPLVIAAALAFLTADAAPSGDTAPAGDSACLTPRQD